MRQPRIGLVLTKGGVAGAAILGRRRLAHWSLEADDTLPARLAAELTALGVPRGRVRLAVDRSLVVVKTIDVPRASGHDLARLIGFEVERHVPFPADELRFDWVASAGSGEPTGRILFAACEARVVTGSLRLTEAIGRRPRSLTVAPHELRSLLPRRLATRRGVWIHRQRDRTDLLCLGDGIVRLSRSLPSQEPDLLAHEVRGTLPLVNWSECDVVWVSGVDAERFLLAPSLIQLGAPVTPPPYHAPAAALIARLPIEDDAAGLLALAVAAGPRQPSLDLLPRELRPRAPSRAQMVTAALAGLVGLLGVGLALTHGYRQERYLDRITNEIRRLEPEVKAVERLAAEVSDRKRLVSLLRSLEEGRLRPLGVLHELTDQIPADAWLQALTLDKEGVELTGQAAAASQLIPVLEGSPRLQRVEFTAPVTKGQDKEQFRLRAAWER